MNNYVVDFLELLDVISKQQFGLRSKHNCLPCCYNFVSRFLSEYEKRNAVLGVFIGLSKAFSSINQGIILWKLYHYGICGTALNWMERYLESHECQQFVSHYNVNSDYKSVTSEVPQGSILGHPLISVVHNGIVTISEKLKLPSFYMQMTQNVFSLGMIFFTWLTPWLLNCPIYWNGWVPINCCAI